MERLWNSEVRWLGFCVASSANDDLGICIYEDIPQTWYMIVTCHNVKLQDVMSVFCVSFPLHSVLFIFREI